jgi:hypothetical protein
MSPLDLEIFFIGSSFLRSRWTRIVLTYRIIGKLMAMELRRQGRSQMEFGNEGSATIKKTTSWWCS